MDEELVRRIQNHTSSNVTTNFVKLLRNLAKVHSHDVDKFIKACMALGKFKGQESFLSELHSSFAFDTTGPVTRNRISGIQDGNPGVAVNPRPLKKSLDKPPRRKTRLLDFDIEEEEILDRASNSINTTHSRDQTSSATRFKKLSKDHAQRLREFSAESVDQLKLASLVPNAERSSPNLVSFTSTDSNAPALEYHSSSEQSSNGYASEALSDSQVLEEDRDWYDHDDDYGNQVSELPTIDIERDASVNREAFRKENKDLNADLKSQIHLSAITPSQRKSLIPPFLMNYSKDASTLANIGILDSSQASSNRRIIDPIRNPDSEFSLNAKKGSRIVAERRTREVHKAKIEDTTDLRGTAIGEVIGVKEKPADGSNIEQKDNDDSKGLEVSFEHIQEIRKSLPAYQVRSELLQLIRDNQVVVVIGETGSGKTTQLAQFLNEDGFCNNGRLVGCTQPRRVAAMSVATRVALEMGVKLGNEVGYSIRFEDKTSKDTRIKFMTDGILLRETLVSESLDKYSCIIMDEAHERSLNTDVLFGILKNLLSKRRDLKLIITSATMNANRFSQFFGAAPQFTIPGRTFPVQVVYSRHPVSDYVESAIVQACKIHLSTPILNGDILIFMTGQEDIEATCAGIYEKLLDVYAKRTGRQQLSKPEDIEILPIYSALPADVQGKIFEPAPNKRKVVVATNIAETSLTVEGVKYVIDCGYSKLKVYNPQIGLDSLQIAPISMASANQRSGRAGRTGPGFAYRLYTEDSFFDDMYVQTIPEIQRTNLSNTLLLLKFLGVDDLMAFPFVDPPPEQIIMTSLFELWTVGALDNFGKLTELGKQLAAFPLQPSLSKMLLVSSQNGCSEEILTVVSMLSVPQVFYRPKEREKESDQARTRFFVPESDHLTLLNVYSQWKANKYSSHWCRRNFLQFKSLQRAREIRRQLYALMNKKKIPVVSSGTDWDIVRKCICAGYAHQAAKLSGLSRYTQLRNGLELRIHPTSALFGAGDLPSYVIYHELLLTTNEYINTVTAVDPDWLMNYGVLFYNVKRRVEDEDFYTEDTHEKRKDRIDLMIEQFEMKKNIITRQIKRDLDAVIETQSQKKVLKDKRTFSRGASNVSIGFKKRRPL
ncbi:LAQU0S20e00672g1_1 [Lachancea quebecensis]|uniref:Pre-mRNA-splicing factor ATP-dependent RNA helicase PRP16 n=1 Tax=Lachancea quebecensis TaxID=1654605 RepID=A0A0N7MMD8_9SACH|nr:LAQU0S20e00672g1_1 [Lachancea quebecensis]